MARSPPFAPTLLYSALDAELAEFLMFAVVNRHRLIDIQVQMIPNHKDVRENSSILVPKGFNVGLWLFGAYCHVSGVF